MVIIKRVARGLQMKTTCHADKKVSAPVKFLALALFLGPTIAFNQSAEIETPKETSEPAPQGKRSSLLPDLDTLMKAKFDALNSKLKEQETELVSVREALAKEQEQQQRIFDDQAYLSMSMLFSAPASDYRLMTTEVLVNGRVVSRGGPKNLGLPRNQERIYFAPLAMGCHEVIVRAKIMRTKTDLISRFKGLNRIETLEKKLTINPRPGIHIDLGVEIFEAVNSIAQFFRKPDIRFNRLVQPNFIKGAPLVSNEEVMQQGQVRISYINDDKVKQELITKSVSIDGLPILSDKVHDANREKDIVFEAPLTEGRHVLQATLVFAEKTWIEGGPRYKFSLTFKREFYVRSGSSTSVQLIALPDGGNRRNPRDARYARVVSEISAAEEKELFLEQTCREYLAQAKSAGQIVIEPAKTEPKNHDTITESSGSDVPKEEKEANPEEGAQKPADQEEPAPKAQGE